MKRRLRSEVVDDLAEAADWYDGRRPGLGLRFLEAVEATLVSIEENPRLYRTVHRDLRRALLPRPFPYQVFFRVRGEVVEVYAVLHMARDPEAWKRRI